MRCETRFVSLKTHKQSRVMNGKAAGVEKKTREKGKREGASTIEASVLEEEKETTRTCISSTVSSPSISLSDAASLARITRSSLVAAFSFGSSSESRRRRPSARTSRRTSRRGASPSTGARGGALALRAAVGDARVVLRALGSGPLPTILRDGGCTETHREKRGRVVGGKSRWGLGW